MRAYVASIGTIRNQPAGCSHSSFDAPRARAYSAGMKRASVAMLGAIVLATLATRAGAQGALPIAGIEERIIRLEEGQHAIEKRLDDLRADMNQRFAGVDKRFDDVGKRFDDIGKRFDDLNHRLNDVMTFLQILVGVLAVMAVGIFGTLLMIWRRLVKVEADVALLSSQFRLVRTP